jgi:hypothetical protein
VGDVKTSIDQLRDALGEGVKQMAKARVEQADAATTQGTGGGLSSDAIMQLTEELRALTTGSIPVDPDSPTQRVSVMHRVPREILEVLTNQFQLMDQWMKPVLESTHQNNTAIKELQGTLESCLGSYSALIAKLEKAKTRQPAKKRKAKKVKKTTT